MIGFNLNDVSSINFGSIGIDSVYVGNTKIWEDTPVSSGYNLLDILYSDANGNLSVDSNVLPTSEGKTPIGLCVAATGFFGDNEPARWMSLKHMNNNTPETGSISGRGVGVGQYLVDIATIPDIYKTYVNGSASGYLTADWITGTDNKIPSLFDANNNWNITQLGTINAFVTTDIDGKTKTAKWLEAATAQPDWRTDSTITNICDAGYSPAACCCARYHTLGTSAGDWYLGAGGEMSMIIVLLNEINTKLQQINTVYPNDCMSSLASSNYWTSTEYDNTRTYYVLTGDGSTNNIMKRVSCNVLAMLNY